MLLKRTRFSSGISFSGDGNRKSKNE